MKQILQSLKSGETVLMDVPAPQSMPGRLLIATTHSLISPGTEKMLVDFGKASWLQKIRQQPDKVSMVLNKIKTDGFLPTLSAVSAKLEQLLPMGYCNVGNVIGIGAGVHGFNLGDRVVSNGAHAEIVSVAHHLCCLIPDQVSDQAAVFSILGAIALQGIRLAKPELGEYFVVCGLGLIGLLTVQLLQTHGCFVLAIDLDAEKTALAKQLGAQIFTLHPGESPLAAAQVFSKQRGVDGVLITAATNRPEPIHYAANMCRKRGRIILVGTAGLDISRADFYEKELTFQVSCSYGPGRYDIDYEEHGHDYPFPFVRFTAKRNIESFLDLCALQKDSSLNMRLLMTHEFAFEDSKKAYALLESKEKCLGIILNYPPQTAYQQTLNVNHTAKLKHALLAKLQGTVNAQRKTYPLLGSVQLGFVGAGNYASRVLIPAFKKTNAILNTIVCKSGVSAAQLAKKYRFLSVSTDTPTLFTNAKIDAVVIATRHDSHATLVLQALKANKHVFVEKPLCLTQAELNAIKKQLNDQPYAALLMIGFNRRFAPHIQKIKQVLQHATEPKALIMTVNAGAIPAAHWTQRHEIGGGRIMGEACHFIDLQRFLVGAPITDYCVKKLQEKNNQNDKVMITLTFDDGSTGVIHYLANGHASFPKERLEIFVGGKILQLDNFRKLQTYGVSQLKRFNLLKQDKGQVACAQHFIEAIKQNKACPIPLEEILEVTQITLNIAGEL